MKTRFVVSFACALAGLGLSFCALAQEWAPSKPVRVIVPVIGSTIDALGRLLAPYLQEALAQPVIVENKPGAGGTLGADFVAKSSPDGHTLLVSFAAPISVNVTLFDKIPYDPQKDLAPVMLAVEAPLILVVHPSLHIQTVAEFIKYAKDHPGKLSYGSGGIGAASHLSVEMLKLAAGINLVHVPYKGASSVLITDLLGGNIQVANIAAGNVLEYIRAGKLNALATTGRKRVSGAPSVPTMIESGFANFEAAGWVGIHAPGRTPKPIIDRYSRELTRILKIPAVHDRLVGTGQEIVASSPEAFAEFIWDETRRWAKVIRETGSKAN